MNEISDVIMDAIKKVLDNSRSIQWKNKNSKRTVLKNIKKSIFEAMDKHYEESKYEDENENEAEELPIVEYGSKHVVKLHDNKPEYHRVLTPSDSAKGDPEHAHE